MSEIDLIREAASGNMGAFAELVRLHREQVLRTAYGIVGSTDEAEDVAQDVFVKVWNNLSDQRHQRAFGSWLYRITVNTAIDVLRRHKEQLPLKEGYRDPEASPEGQALRQDGRYRVRQAIAELPPSARVTLILREYEQLSYKEIAEVLDIPIGTVMSRLSYARRLLKEKLETLSEEG